MITPSYAMRFLTTKILQEMTKEQIIRDFKDTMHVKDDYELNEDEIYFVHEILKAYEKGKNLGVIGDVSKPFKEGARVKVTENTSGHEFDIDEIVTIVEFEPQYSQWNCIGKDGAMWYIGEHEGNVC